MMSALVVALSGLFTIIAVVVGCVFTYRRMRQIDSGGIQQAQHNMAAGRSELASEKNTTSSKADGGNKWPIDPSKTPTKTSAPITDCENEDKVVGDCMDYCGHIQREIKRTKQRIALDKIAATMTPEQRDEERAAQRRQLEDIYRLMEDQKDKFGFKSVDDMQEQMKLYIQ